MLFGHIVVFSLAGCIHPIAIVHIGMVVFWIVAFLSGTGLYFSARFRHTTAAVIANFALAGVLWALGPIILGMIVGITRGEMDLFTSYIDSHPFVQVGVAIDGATNASGIYSWPGMDSVDGGGVVGAVQSTRWILKCTLGFTFVGWIFAWRAKCRFRRAIF
jgi:hypothetical protein